MGAALALVELYAELHILIFIMAAVVFIILGCAECFKVCYLAIARFIYEQWLKPEEFERFDRFSDV